VKRSKANKIFLARLSLSTKYDCFSIKTCGECAGCKEGTGECEENTSDPQFSYSGCDCCHGGASDVYEVSCLTREEKEKCEFDLCGGCLCSMVNGDDTDLDYYITDEDEPPCSDLYELVSNVRNDISPESRAFEGDEEPGIQLTVGWDPKDKKWSYQTGDNSFTGGAYSCPIWAVVAIYVRSKIESVIKDILNQIQEQQL